MFKALKGSRTSMNQWINNVHKDAIIRKNRQNSIELKCIVTKIKKSLDELGRNFEMAEESVISVQVDRMLSKSRGKDGRKVRRASKACGETLSSYVYTKWRLRRGEGRNLKK